MFHKHIWTIEKEYIQEAPIKSVASFAEAPAWAFESKTTIIWRCNECKKIRTEVVSGLLASPPQKD